MRREISLTHEEFIEQQRQQKRKVKNANVDRDVGRY